VVTWLRAHPGVQVIARDRASDYSRGATEGAPEATQVADRFHLLCNLHEVLTRDLQRITPALRCLLASASVAAPRGSAREGLEEPTSAERGSGAGVIPQAALAPQPALRPLPRYGRSPRLQQEQSARHAARVHRYEQVKTRFAQGQSLRQIAAACGLNTKTVRSWVRSEALPLDQRGYRGVGKIDPYTAYLQTRLAEGCTNQSRLWREIRAQGFTGTRSLVAKWIHAHDQHTPVVPAPAAPQLPAARQLTWLLYQDAEKRSAADQALVEQLQQPTELTHVQQLVQQGATMIRQH
jgi:transposase